MRESQKIKEILEELEDGKILLKLSKRLYEKEAIFSAGYKFTDLCYVYIEPIDEGYVGVFFKAKENSSNQQLKDIAHQYINEVLDQQIRLDLEKRYGNIRELIVEHAFKPIKNIADRIKIKHESK